MKLYEIAINPHDYEHDKEIKKLISKYANDPHIKITSAVWLIHKIYHELGLEIPRLMSDDKFWDYQNYALLATQKLQSATDNGVRDDEWKITPSSSPFAKLPIDKL